MSSAPYERPRMLPAGDAALTVELGDAISPEINERVLEYDAALRALELAGVLETVPTYRSLTIHYDPSVLTLGELAAAVRALDPERESRRMRHRRWRLPVAYGGAYGIDLDAVASQHGLSPEQVVALHSGAEYRVYMIGFAPGFSYLGGLDERLHTPRRADPRARTPAGSVSIGGMQAAVSSVEVPSGWHLLGRTPVRTFDLRRDPPFLLAVGDLVRFDPIPHSEWEALDRRAAAGELVARGDAAP